ncbi:hypothetical protein JMJ77_0003085 [Colletotrichum scovillei]|uniref:Uncharacterized protein n=1 Tax=Colletotrichum scovillei TaxID=1209932 RepID=A0A9P7QVC9_9PEZI|nr:hypothetical protein JMJ78_0006292 [Colletotrichum scovillei]KAG7043379.1 hypothetical protein JMJ77_0003085 [Colletotrichum scovillei]KAG7062827.1 hypothetical protein JMJ76_0009670 [Colletotrichum scovillei]
MSTPFLRNSQRHNCYTPSTPSSYPALLEPSDRQIVNAFWCVSSHICPSSGLPSTQDMSTLICGRGTFERYLLDHLSTNKVQRRARSQQDMDRTWRPRDAGPNHNFHLQTCTTRVMMLKSPALGTCSYVTSNMHRESLQATRQR